MISLLHVDSDTTLQKAFKEYMVCCDEISVVSIQSANEALDLLKTIRFDIIVSEYYLPITDGQTFLEILRRSRKNLTPFILTNHWAIFMYLKENIFWVILPAPLQRQKNCLLNIIPCKNLKN